jgi:hypothetical protein
LSMRPGVKWAATALALVCIIVQEGYVSVGSPKIENLKELTGMAQIIVLAQALPAGNAGAADSGLMKIVFLDSGKTIPPMESRVFRFRKIEILKNAPGADLPETLSVFPANTEGQVDAHRRHFTDGSSVNPVNKYYASSLSEKDLAAKPVLLFLNREMDGGLDPAERLEYTASQSYEKGSRKKAVAKLVAQAKPAPAPVPPRLPKKNP